MVRASDAAFVAACKAAGLEVGVGSGLLLLAVRKVFEAGVRHQALRHMSMLWAVHEMLAEQIADRRSPSPQADADDMINVRGHIEKIRKDYL